MTGILDVRGRMIIGAKVARSMGVPDAVVARFGNQEVGLLMCEDSDTGERWLVAGDPAAVRMLEQAHPSEYAGLIDSPESFPVKRRGWPQPSG